MDELLIEEIRIFNIDMVKFAHVLFTKTIDCEKVFSFFNHPVKLQNYPTLNSLQEVISFSYCYDLTDIRDSKWFAVVLRNLDTDCEVEKIQNFCKGFVGESSVFYALPPEIIYDSACTLVVLDDLDSAEKLCSAINLQQIRGIFTGKILKVKFFI